MSICFVLAYLSLIELTWICARVGHAWATMGEITSCVHSTKFEEEKEEDKEEEKDRKEILIRCKH